ncbi:hypothetical protein QBC39DRAFT_103631 [Podospora conica]|nr:hypothetical protein QBC39DRAFT_103631 [Schizothecium conicum]
MPLIVLLFCTCVTESVIGTWLSSMTSRRWKGVFDVGLLLFYSPADIMPTSHHLTHPHIPNHTHNLYGTSYLHSHPRKETHTSNYQGSKTNQCRRAQLIGPTRRRTTSPPPYVCGLGCCCPSLSDPPQREPNQPGRFPTLLLLGLVAEMQLPTRERTSESGSAPRGEVEAILRFTSAYLGIRTLKFAWFCQAMV